ncbi:hypothetical protein [Rossellomorea marisflavi]|uniref:hypothetical protein n=1 Tax=Rossellomorea marisflavi TaxID=189381 RepID=UPI003F9F134D
MKKEVKVTESALKEVIDALGGAFQAQAEEEHYEACAKYIEEHGEHLHNPEHFDLFVNSDSAQLREVLVRNLLKVDKNGNPIEYSRSQLSELMFLYTNYGFMKNHLYRIIIKYEGHGCSADKTRYILALHQENIVTGNSPLFKDTSNYYVPDLGQADKWMAFTKSLHHLFYGNTEDYLKAHTELIAQLEKEVKELKEKQESIFTSSPLYQGHEQRNGFGKEIYQVYTFQNNLETLEIHQHDNGGWGYVLLVEGKQYGYAEQKEGLFPEWVTSLFKLLNEIE